MSPRPLHNRPTTILVRHWLTLFLVGWGWFILLPLAAPWLAMHGQERLSDLIYVAYRPACHQLPHRSWFLGGPRHSYEWETLRARLGIEGDEYQLFHKPVRDPRVGYQMAYCQRDAATHTAVWLSGIGYGLLRRRRAVPRLPLRWFLLASLPLAMDGLAQLLGWRESSPLSRTLTGALFGLAAGWFILPELGQAAEEWCSQQTSCSTGSPLPAATGYRE